MLTTSVPFPSGLSSSVIQLNAFYLCVFLLSAPPPSVPTQSVPSSQCQPLSASPSGHSNSGPSTSCLLLSELSTLSIPQCPHLSGCPSVPISSTPFPSVPSSAGLSPLKPLTRCLPPQYSPPLCPFPQFSILRTLLPPCIPLSANFISALVVRKSDEFIALI
jgi:hypothetical protein